MRLTEQEAKDLKFKQDQQKQREQELHRLDNIAHAIAECKNPNAGTVTVKDSNGNIKHVYHPPKKEHNNATQRI
jgi:hypothetical protein